MKVTSLQLLLATALAIHVVACGTTEPQVALCGPAQAFEEGDDEFCVASNAIVIETGFRCPPTLPNPTEWAECLVCSMDTSPSAGLLNRLTARYYEATGEERPDAVCEDPADELLDGLDNDCDGEIDEDMACDSDAACDVGACIDGYCEDSGSEGVCADGSDPQPEILDGLDNDCDGMVDEGLGECTDEDGDGYGDGDGCLGTDCDDGDASINPGATDVSDGVDNDCDGAIDEDASCASDADCAAGQACVDGVCEGDAP